MINKTERVMDESFVKVFSKDQRLISTIALLMTLFILYTAAFGFFPSLIQRPVFVGFALVLAYLMHPHVSKKNRSIGIMGGVGVILAVICTGWVAINSDRFMTMGTESNAYDLAFAVILVLLLLEAARRTMGPIFAVLTVITIVYAFVGPWLPGNFAHRGFSFEFIAQHLYVGSYGIWGTTTGTMVGMVAIFILFGAILSITGGAKVFLNIATLFGGRAIGGPAKVAVIGSSLFGMVSGSASANGAVIGAMTIPMMKKSGYDSEFAAAAEAVAGTGGQIMPPIMGAGAFIIAEKLGVTYLTVAAAAIIPAVIYYVGLFAAIHFTSLKNGMQALSKEEFAKAKESLEFHSIVGLFIPLIVLIVFLARGYTVATSGVIASILAIVLYVFTDLDTRAILRRSTRVIVAFVDGAKGLIVIALLGACADIIIGMLSLTGLGVEISSAIYSLSGGYLLLGLFLGMITTLILGMGLPTTAAFILGSSVVAPALAEFNLNPMAINLFLFYFACISAFTPPVCVAIYITAGIADCNWVKAGYRACQLGAAGFLVPYLAVFESSLILQGTIFSIIIDTLIALCGTIMLAAAMMGNFFYDINWFYRLVLFAGGLATLVPGYLSSGIGIASAIMVFILVRGGSKGSHIIASF